MSTTIGGSTNARTAAAQSTQTATLSPTEATNTWKTELSNELAERAKLEQDSFGFLPPHRIDTYKAKVEADMAKFVEQNPKATADEIKMATLESIKKHSTHEVIGKMEFEYFIKKMSSRMQELSSDMWK